MALADILAADLPAPVARCKNSLSAGVVGQVLAADAPFDSVLDGVFLVDQNGLWIAVFVGGQDSHRINLALIKSVSISMVLVMPVVPASRPTGRAR